MTFSFSPLPIVQFSISKRKYDALGSAQSDQDILKIEKISAPKVAHDEVLKNATTKQPTKVVTNRKQFIDCLQEQFNSPEIEELSLEEFSQL